MLHALALSPLLAELSDKDQPMLFWLIMGGVVALCMVVNAILGSAVSWQQLRNSDKQHECVSRSELREIHARVDGITLGLSTEVGKMRGELVALIKEEKSDTHKHRDKVTEQLAGIERSMGRLEGMEKTVEDHNERLLRVERRH